MAIDYDRLMAWPIPDAAQDYTEKDCILYALGLGFGSDPVDPVHLRYVYEGALTVFPTIATVLASGGSWSRDPGTGIDYAKVVHAGQSFELHRPLPPRGSVVSRSRVTDVIDKGPGHGAIVVSQRQLFLDGEDTPTATLSASLFARADGGFAGPVVAGARPHALPGHAPTYVVSVTSLPQAALLYRLSGDYNELHADPRIAVRAGFDRPILHGLCSFGMAIRAVAEGVGADPQTIVAGGVRFVAPVYPGETLETSIWLGGDTASFRTRAVDRDLPVLNNGWVRFADD